MAFLISQAADMTPEEQLSMPAQESIDRLKGHEVQAEDGSMVSFKSLVEDGNHSRVLTVFIRHFFCGFCEMYVTALMKDLPPATLSGLQPPTKLVVIGCGDRSLIADYKERTGCSYPVYADPTRSTYTTLGFAVTLANGGQKRPDYATRSFMSVVWSSFVNNVSAGPSRAFSGGKTSQNGGELLWVNGELQFIHRMATTTDHLGVADLKSRLEE